jgi:hypothetical protein
LKVDVFQKIRALVDVFQKIRAFCNFDQKIEKALGTLRGKVKLGYVKLEKKTLK